MTTEALTNQQVCEAALRKIGVIAMDTTATADEIETARAALSRMLKAWQNRGYNLWAVTAEEIDLFDGIEVYSLGAERPLEIQSCRLERSGIETPMTEFNREEYDTLPQKMSEGVPTCWYYDRQRETGDIYVWPVPSVDATYTLQVTYVRETSDVALASEADIPSEWYDAVVYGLAARLADDFMVPAQNVMARAEEELRLALAYDRQGSVYFVGSDYT
jgi:hypothetical protein